MMNLKKSISFIGMAGCGKTTIGRLFAKKHRISFIDTDDLIEKRLNKSLQDIKDEKGYMYLREIEQEMVLTIDASIQIISTGGSVIYSEQAITHLKQISSVVFVDTPYELIKKRIGDASVHSCESLQRVRGGFLQHQHAYRQLIFVDDMQGDLFKDR